MMVRARAGQDFGESVDALETGLFADRVTESEAFADALSAHRRRLDDEVGEEHDPRGRNILVFHGRGGVGKSELSERLEDWVNGSVHEREHWGQPPSAPVAATVRLDLHSSHGHIDAAAELARIRIALGRLKPRWPLFDLAFAAYWAASHPGESLPLLEDEADSQIAPTAIELLAAMSEDFGSPSTLAGISVQAMRALLGRATDRLRSRERVDVPDGYDRLFERCTIEPAPDSAAPDLLGMLAGLLAYELDRFDGPVPLVVVFIDTFERLTLDSRRAGENVLNRVVYTMSNVLFVITGRNRLTWWELAGPALPFRGPSHWPQLGTEAVAEPRQHALEHLSEKDRRLLVDLLWQRLALPESADLREAVAQASGGLPEYIRLSLHAASSAHAQGLPLTEQLVTGSFDDLVQRLLEHTAADEQRAIRAAALLHHADTALIAAAGGVEVGAAERAAASALFTARTVGDAVVPALHDEVRRAIRNASHRMTGGWAEGDWDAAGTRALLVLRERHTAAREAYRNAPAADAIARSGPGRELLSLTAQAIGVTCETNPRIGAANAASNPDWVAEAMTNGPSYAGLRPFLPATSRTESGRAVLDFLSAKSADVTRPERVQILTDLYERGGRLQRIAGRHLAYALRDGGNWDEAMRVLDEMLLAQPDSVLVRRQRVVTLTQGRRFLAAEQAVELAEEKARDYLRASIGQAHGHLEAFIDAVDRRLADMRASPTRALKDMIELEGIRLRYTAFLGLATREEIAGVAALADSVGHEGCRRDALFATILVDGNDAALHDLEVADRARNDGLIASRTAWALVALGHLAGDVAELRRVHGAVIREEVPRGVGWIATETGLADAGLTLPEPPTEWVQPREQVAARWSAHWAHWRSRASAATL